MARSWSQVPADERDAEKVLSPFSGIRTVVEPRLERCSRKVVATVVATTVLTISIGVATHAIKVPAVQPTTARTLLEDGEFTNAAADQVMSLGHGAFDRSLVRSLLAKNFADHVETAPEDLMSIKLTQSQRDDIMHLVGHISDQRVQDLGRNIAMMLHSTRTANSGEDKRRLLASKLLPHLNHIKTLREEILPSSIKDHQLSVLPAIFYAVDADYVVHQSSRHVARRLGTQESEEESGAELFTKLIDVFCAKPQETKPSPLAVRRLNSAIDCAKQQEPPPTMHAIEVKNPIAHCGLYFAEVAFAAVGDDLTATAPNKEEEQASRSYAEPVYNPKMAQAFISLAQLAQCGPKDIVKNYTCPECKEVGFELAPGTHRFVEHEEVGKEGATFVLVARARGSYPHSIPRPAEPLAHSSEDCRMYCGDSSGYCSWCGVGNACCRGGDPTEPVECQEVAWTLSEKHTCVQVNPNVLRPAQVANAGQDCYEKCGMVGGYCDHCGGGNMCCKRGSMGDPPECHAASAFITDGYECVAKRPSSLPPPALLSSLGLPLGESGEAPKPSPSDFGCVISFRGSQNSQNTVMNMDFAQEELPFVECQGCMIHAGFHKVWRAVQSKIMNNLIDLGCTPGGPRSSLLVVGESFGAAVGTIAMYYLQAKGFNVELSYNFGSPRVGNFAWASNFNGRFGRPVPVFRMTHAHDVVSRIPPVNFMGYRHVNSETYYPAENVSDYTVCFDGEAAECGNRYNMAQCLGSDLLDSDHCQSGLALGGDMCACTAEPWWKWYNATVTYHDKHSKWYKPLPQKP